MRLPSTSYPAVRYWSNKTPPADYLGVVVMLKEPSTVTVEMGYSTTTVPHTKIAARKFPAGVYFWLIYHPLKRGDESAIANVDPNNNKRDENPEYPENQSDDFFVTKLSKGLSDGEVFVSVERDGNNIGYFMSHMPIARTAGGGNLATVGNIFELKLLPKGQQ